MENIKIKLPVSGTEAELRPYITTIEKRQIRGLLMASATLSPSGTAMLNLRPEIVDQAEDKTFEVIVLSLAGTAENLIARIKALHGNDYEFLLKEVTKIEKGITEEKKI